jgi:hypothetical protein
MELRFMLTVQGTSAALIEHAPAQASPAGIKFAPHRALSILHVLRAPVGGLFRHVLDLARGAEQT